MMQKIENHAGVALERLLEQYKESPNFKTVVTQIAAQVQALENTGFDLLQARFPATATGNGLDKLGEVLNVTRDGNNDGEYRSRIYAKIGQYVSIGSPEAIISIFLLLMQADYIVYKEVYPAKVFMTAVGATPVSNVQAIKESLDRAKPAGVSLEYLATVAGRPFVFDGDPDPNGGGFGDLDNPDVGGVLALIL